MHLGPQPEASPTRAPPLGGTENGCRGATTAARARSQDTIHRLLSYLSPSRRLRQAGVTAQRVVEGLEDALRRPAGRRVDLILEVAVLGGRRAAKGVRRAGNEGPPFLPDTLPSGGGACREERVEAASRGGIDAAQAGAGIGRIEHMSLAR